LRRYGTTITYPYCKKENPIDETLTYQIKEKLQGEFNKELKKRKGELDEKTLSFSRRKEEFNKQKGQQRKQVERIVKSTSRIAEEGAQRASSVLKELPQKTDDAWATEVSIILSKRIPTTISSDQYKQSCCPAIIIGNSALFRDKREAL
jgi:hypothetical protein